MNQFADVSKDELKNAMKSYIKPTRRTQQVYLGNINDIPDAFDWRDQHIGAESQPRDQGWCLKSSWAFSAVSFFLFKFLIQSSHSIAIISQVTFRNENYYF